MVKINKLFNYDSGRNIWRIVLTDLNQIVIEERDISKKEVYFSCIDRVTGVFFWKDKVFLNEKFWIGIENTRSNYLILHQFEKPDMPEHKKIITIDLRNGEVLWINDELKFYEIDNQYVYGFKSSFDEKEFFQLSIKTGEIIKFLGTEEEARVVIDQVEEKDYSRYNFTSMYNQSETTDSQKELIHKIIGSNNYMNFCEFIDRGNIFIFNYYDKIEERSLINRLVIVDTISERPILIETLNSSTPAPVPDSFFMYDDDLYFIKDKTELVAYRLSQ